MGFKKTTKKSAGENVKMEWKFRSRIPHSRPCFLLSQRLSIVSIVLLMTNIDCKIVVFFSIKIVFFAQSMQAKRDLIWDLICYFLTSLPSLTLYSFTMFTSLQKINILMFFAHLSLLLFQHRETKAGTNLHLHTTLKFYDCLKPLT